MTIAYGLDQKMSEPQLSYPKGFCVCLESGIYEFIKDVYIGEVVTSGDLLVNGKHPAVSSPIASDFRAYTSSQRIADPFSSNYDRFRMVTMMYSAGEYHYVSTAFSPKSMTIMRILSIDSKEVIVDVPHYDSINYHIPLTSLSVIKPIDDQIKGKNLFALELLKS